MVKKSPGLTKREKEVLMELLKDGRASDQAIAKRLKTSRPTVFKIRKRLEMEGYIKGYSALSDFDKIGIKINAILFYQWKDYSKQKELKEFIEHVKKLPEVVCYIRGESAGNKTDVIISVHEDLRACEKFITSLKQLWKNYVENIEVFVSSMENIVKPYSFNIPLIKKLDKELMKKL